MASSVPVKVVGTSGGGGGSRWCPTPEQVMLLEGMYRGGLKTPTATQIQQITARLSVYGKVQGKNVFYWFQNHKARDRQKLRKKLMTLYHQQHLHLNYPPATATTHHPPHHPYNILPPQHHHHQVDGVKEDSSKHQAIINIWKKQAADLQSNNNNNDINNNNNNNNNKSCRKLLICDCQALVMPITTMGTSPYYFTSSCSSSRVPPKTLQLFPLTASANLIGDDDDDDDDDDA